MIQHILSKRLYLRYCYWRARRYYEMAHWEGGDDIWRHECWSAYYDWTLHAAKVRGATT